MKRQHARTPGASVSKSKRLKRTRPPQFAAELVFVEGLESRVLLSAAHHVAHHNFIVIHPSSHIVRKHAVNGPTGMTPAMIRQAYGINQVSFNGITGDGSGQTIAIVDAYNDPTIVSDLHTFDTRFGLSDPTLTRLNQRGGTTLPGTDPAGRGNSWAMETSLDVEWAHAIAPKANILLVLANSANDGDLNTAIATAKAHAGVSVVSLSWGGDESSSDPSGNSMFTTPANHQGVTFLVASGDSGAYGSTGATTVGYPAASPNVVAVGGTSLNTDSAGDYLSESGWGNGRSSAGLGGSGGGLSRYEAQPSYQSGVVLQSSTQRALPDVAFDADPNSGVAIYDSWDTPSTPWLQIGGTSLAAPAWAGLIAIANQGRALAGESTLDGRSQTLPMLYAAPSSDFHDITSGSNGYNAGPGFDLVTGRGTPIADRLIPDLVAASVPTPSPTPTPTATPTPSIGAMSASPSSAIAGTTVTVTASNVLESGGAVSSVDFYVESNGTPGLQSTDTYLGAGANSGLNWSIRLSTSGAAPGAYTIYAVASDASGANAVSQTNLTITAPSINNDNFAGATVETGTSFSVTGTNINATRESGEQPLITGTGGGHSVWWSWTAPASGRVTLSTQGSNFDTTLAVYTGSSVASLTRVAANDDASYYNLTSALAFNAVAGTTYYFAVDGYGRATGSIQLNLNETLPPANNNFANAAALAGTSFTWNGSNRFATREPSEPQLAGNGGGTSVWFSWTAPTDGNVSLDTYGSNFDTMLGVYVGSSLATLSPVAGNDDAVPGYTLQSAVNFQAVAGTTYYFTVDGYNGASGAIQLNLLES